MVSTGHFLGIRLWETKAKWYNDSEKNISKLILHIMWHSDIREDRKDGIKTVDEGVIYYWEFGKT